MAFSINVWLLDCRIKIQMFMSVSYFLWEHAVYLQILVNGVFYQELLNDGGNDLNNFSYFFSPLFFRIKKKSKMER